MSASQDQIYFNIDGRIVTSPIQWEDVAVVGDSGSRKIKFITNKFVDGINLYTKNIRVNFVNAGLEEGQDLVSEKENISTEKFCFYWVLSSNVCKTEGFVKFSIEFYSEAESFTLSTIQNSNKIFIQKSITLGEHEVFPPTVQQGDYKDDPVFISNRQIIIPDNKKISAVEGDKNSQFISFIMDKKIDGIDLTKKTAHIAYINAEGIKGCAPTTQVSVVQSDDSLITFGWILDALVCNKPGKVSFSVFFTNPTNDSDDETEDTESDYFWSTMPATVFIEKGIGEISISPQPTETWMANWLRQLSQVAQIAASYHIDYNIHTVYSDPQESTVTELKIGFKGKNDTDFNYTPDIVKIIEGIIGDKISSDTTLRAAILAIAQEVIPSQFIVDQTFDGTSIRAQSGVAISSIVNAKANKDALEEANKRIENLALLAKGVLYNDQIDSTVAYTKAIPAGAQKYASIDKIGGKTVVFNQLANKALYPATTTYNGVTFTNNNDGTITANGTNVSVDELVYTLQSLTLDTTHKYLSIGCPVTDFPQLQKPFLRITNATDSDYGNGAILQPTVSSTSMSIRIPASITVSAIIFKPQLFDLTLMFGAGNEPTTVDQFRKMFPDTMYSYDAGSLLSAKTNKIVSVSKNLFDFSKLPNTITNATVNKTNNTITVNANTTNVGSGKTLKQLCPELRAGDTVTLNAVNSSAVADKLIYLYSIQTSWSFGTSKTITQDILNSSVYFYNKVNNPDANTISEIQIVRGSYTSQTIPSYTPYKSPIEKTIPQAVLNLEGYGLSAGTVYNEIDWERRKLIKRVGSIDLGTLTWVVGYDGFYTAGISNIKYASTTTEQANIVCKNYVTKSYSAKQNKTICAWSGGNCVLITDNSYSSAEAFKTAMNGVILYYELVTPAEVDISDKISEDNLIEVEAGGSLTFEQVGNYQLPTPNTETFIIKVANAI